MLSFRFDLPAGSLSAAKTNMKKIHGFYQSSVRKQWQGIQSPTSTTHVDSSIKTFNRSKRDLVLVITSGTNGYLLLILDAKRDWSAGGSGKDMWVEYIIEKGNNRHTEIKFKNEEHKLLITHFSRCYFGELTISITRHARYNIFIKMKTKLGTVAALSSFEATCSFFSSNRS